MIEELSYVWITDNKSPEAETCMNRFNVSNADQLSDEYCVGNCSNCLEGALNWFHPAIVIMFYRKKIEDYLQFLTHAGETRFPIFA